MRKSEIKKRMDIKIEVTDRNMLLTNIKTKK
jgi:hypothetical protein